MSPKQIDADYDRESDRLSSCADTGADCDLHRTHLRTISNLMDSYWSRSNNAAVRAALMRFDCPANWLPTEDFIGTHAWAGRMSNALVRTNRQIEAGMLWADLARNRTTKYAKSVASEYCKIASKLRGANLLSTYDTVLRCIVCAEAAVAQLAVYVADTKDANLKKALASVMRSLDRIRTTIIAIG